MSGELVADMDARNEAHRRLFGLHDVREDGTVADKYDIETHYMQWTAFHVFEGDAFVRVVADNGGTDIEIRLHRATLEKMLEAFPTTPKEP